MGCWKRWETIVRASTLGGAAENSMCDSDAARAQRWRMWAVHCELLDRFDNHQPPKLTRWDFLKVVLAVYVAYNFYGISTVMEWDWEVAVFCVITLMAAFVPARWIKKRPCLLPQDAPPPVPVSSLLFLRCLLELVAAVFWTLVGIIVLSTIFRLNNIFVLTFWTLVGPGDGGAAVFWTIFAIFVYKCKTL